MLRNLDSVRNTPLDTTGPAPDPLLPIVSVALSGREEEEDEEEEEEGRVPAAEDWSKEWKPSNTSALLIASLTAGLRLLPPTSTTSFISRCSAAAADDDDDDDSADEPLAVCVVSCTGAARAPLSPCGG